MNHFPSPSPSSTLPSTDNGNAVKLVLVNEGYSPPAPPLMNTRVFSNSLYGLSPPAPEPEPEPEPAPAPADVLSEPPTSPNLIPPSPSSYLEPSPPLSNPSSGYESTTPYPKHSSSNNGLVVGVVVGVIILVLATLIASYFFWFKKRQRGDTNKELHESTPPNFVSGAQDSTPANTSGQSKITESNGSSINMSSLSSTNSSSTKIAKNTNTFTFEEMSEATNKFSKDNLLGQGGFGHVYKGVLSCGKPVAIKQLKAGSQQGEKEFMAEIEIISHIHHRNLVSLVGYSVQGTQRLLVYEFLPNDSLAFHLHARQAETLAWDIRMQIAIGSAKGLAYLHEDCEPKIIHRDIKATNILLDSNYKAKVSDFGLAKFVAESETHISTRVMGTLGYLAPEYASSGKLTDKSDVYSFGVVLLEILSGRNAIDLTEWARPLLSKALESNNFDELVDPKLEKRYDNVDMRRMVACARACIHPFAHNRPQMIEIARVLEGVMSPDDLKAPKENLSDVIEL